MVYSDVDQDELRSLIFEADIASSWARLRNVGLIPPKLHNLSNMTTIGSSLHYALCVSRRRGFPRICEVRSSPSNGSIAA